MARFVSLWLPRWPTDRLRRQMGPSAPPRETPILLKGSDGRRRVAMAVNGAAQAAGLYRGMPVTKAQALVAGVAVYDFDPRADLEGLDRLAQWALRRFSPVAAADPPDGLVIDITGAAHLKGGEAALLDMLIQALADQNIVARAAIAGSWGAAHAFARFGGRFWTGSGCILPPSEDSRWLPGLPVAALRLTDDTINGLAALGFDTIGEVAAQPRAPLIHRFGPDLGRRLDQAFGRVSEPILPVDLPDVPAVTRNFAEPIGAPETLARYTGKLTAQICARLEDRCLGATQLDLRFHRVDNRIEAARIRLARPSRDIQRLTRLLCDQIETIAPGFGIERMTLVASATEPFVRTQFSTSEQPKADISTLIDTLSNRNDVAHIYSLASLESDVPERSFQRVAPLVAAGDTWSRDWPRPIRLLAKPERVTTLGLLPDYAPRVFTWRGARHEVVAADGPERVFGEWWKRDSEIHAVRDYFRVEIETGERYWLFRSGDGEDGRTGSRAWFLHGIFA